MGFLEGETRIVNLALVRLGEATISDLDTETNERARTMRLLYEHVRDEELQKNWWNFASARVQPARDSDTPIFNEWTYGYELPANYLQAKYLYNPVLDGTFEIEGNLILCNEENPQLKFIKRITDTTLFTPLFVKALYLQLAFAAGPKITGNRARKSDIWDEYNAAIADARRLNAIEDKPPTRADNERTSPKYTWSNR